MTGYLQAPAGVKDSNGNKIDPSIKSPTDGYGIANVDSATYPAYYGFINKVCTKVKYCTRAACSQR